MKNWHVRHKIFHMVFKDIDMGDDLSKETIIEEYDKEAIIKRALQYPVTQTKELYYPGKSYAVAVIFAHLLKEHFNEEFYESLSDPQLLYGNDPYFVPYAEDKNTYDAIIGEFPWDVFLSENGSENFYKTCEYFMKEFLLHEETRAYAPPK